MYQTLIAIALIIGVIIIFIIKIIIEKFLSDRNYYLTVFLYVVSVLMAIVLGIIIIINYSILGGILFIFFSIVYLFHTYLKQSF